MKTCLKCNVKIYDDTNVCPLCRGVMPQSGETSENRYPEITKQRQKMKLAVRIYLLAVIAAYAVMKILAVALDFQRDWDILVGGCLLYVFLTFQVSFLGRRGYRFKMFMQTVFALLLVILIDIILGFYGWSLNYVLPAVFVLFDVAVLILMLVNSRNWQSYLPAQILIVFMSLVGVMLYAFHIINVWIPAVVGFVIVCIIFLGTILVGGQRSVQELRRRFHL